MVAGRPLTVNEARERERGDRGESGMRPQRRMDR
jgi:hypothetical protein